MPWWRHAETQKYPKLEHTLWICNVVFIQIKTRSIRSATHLKRYKSYQCGALHRLPTAARDKSSNGLASKNRVPATSEMSSGSGRTLVTRMKTNKNEDKRNRNRKNKFGDNRRTARNMAAVAIPSTYIITKRFWSWDTQRQGYKKHVYLPQGLTMQPVSAPEKQSPRDSSFASAVLPFARRKAVIQRCLQLPTTFRQITRAATLKFTSSWSVCIPTELRTGRAGFRIPVGVRQFSVLQVNWGGV